MRTADLTLNASSAEVRELEARAARSDAVSTIAELEAGEREVQRRIEGLLSSTSGGRGDEDEPRSSRRGHRPMDVG
jgi:hypothetical protein